jgi:hypothetical protein
LDLVNVLHSIEGAIFEVASWILYIPKTLFQTLFHPAWIQGYVSAEWSKEPPDRFTEHMSPVLLWLIAGVVPSTLLTLLAKASIALASAFANLARNFEQLVVLLAVSLAIQPLAFSVGTLLLAKKPLDKESLKRQFYIQCLCYAGSTFLAQIALLPVLAALNFPDDMIPLLSLAVLLFLGVFGWFTLAEAYTLKQELKITLGRASVRAIALLVSVLVVGMVIGGCLGGVLTASGALLP